MREVSDMNVNEIAATRLTMLVSRPDAREFMISATMRPAQSQSYAWVDRAVTRTVKTQDFRENENEDLRKPR